MLSTDQIKAHAKSILSSKDMPADVNEISVAHCHHGYVYIIHREDSGYWGCLGDDDVYSMLSGNRNFGPLNAIGMKAWMDALGISVGDLVRIDKNVREGQQVCTCGSHAIGCNSHSHWCDIN